MSKDQGKDFTPRMHGTKQSEAADQNFLRNMEAALKDLERERLQRMKPAINQKALIYCRTSSEVQSAAGALDVQEATCKGFAEQHSINVTNVFSEISSSHGPLQNRPEMSALLAHVEDNPEDQFLILVDHPDRLCRDLTSLRSFSAVLNEFGAKAFCVNRHDSLSGGDWLEDVLSRLEAKERSPSTFLQETESEVL